MDERGMFAPEIAESRAADVMVTIWNEGSIGESMKLSDELRRQGFRVLLYPEADKLGKQFKYASQINIPYVCVLGEAELSENKVTVKNMLTGKQETLSAEKAVEMIRNSD
jgi:histidyl-tRNA synthetase